MLRKMVGDYDGTDMYAITFFLFFPLLLLILARFSLVLYRPNWAIFLFFSFLYFLLYLFGLSWAWIKNELKSYWRIKEKKWKKRLGMCVTRATSEPIHHIEVAHVEFLRLRWWPSLVSLDSSQWEIYLEVARVRFGAPMIPILISFFFLSSQVNFYTIISSPFLVCQPTFFLLLSLSL